MFILLLQAYTLFVLIKKVLAYAECAYGVQLVFLSFFCKKMTFLKLWG